jgi:EpsI family protein
MSDTKTRLAMKNALIAAALMLATFTYLKFMSHGTDVPPLKPFSTFPKQIGEFIGKEQFFSDEIYAAVGVDDSALISYVSPMNESVQLYIGYYKSQRKGDMIHSPKNCMPGSGWEITSSSLEDVEQRDGKTISIIKLILEKGAEKQIVLYWFHARGRIINSEYKQKIYLVIDSIIRNRTDDSFIRLISPVLDKKDDETLAYMKRFIKDLFPVLDDFIPK